MEWINESLKFSELDIDDLFHFDTSLHVTSCCAFEREEKEDVEPEIFICNRGCDHGTREECSYEHWKDLMIEEFRESFETPLEEEAFFRPPKDIPGGEELLERTQEIKRKRAEKFHKRVAPDI